MSFGRAPRRFSHRVFMLLAVSLLVVSSIFTTYFLRVQKQRLEAALVDRSRGLGGLLATGARVAVFSENPRLVQETLAGVVERRDMLSAAVFSLDGALVAAAGRSPALEAAAGRLDPGDLAIVKGLGLESGCLNHEDAQTLDAYCPVLLRERSTSAEDLHFSSLPGEAEKQYIGFVRVTLDRKPLLRELGQLVLRSLAMMAAILAVGSWAGLLFSRRVTEPLERLTDAVRAFGAGREIPALPGMPDDETGRLAVAFTTMTHDLAEREREAERLEQSLRHAQKMEAVATLSQGISHDFKNILSTLKTAVHILQKGSPDNEFVLKYTEKMQTSIDRARDLVERLVTFSRTRQLDLQPLDLAVLITRLTPMLREAVGEAVRVSVDVPQEPVRVEADPGSLAQLLLNLAYNGRDAMPDGGVLCVGLKVLPAAFAGDTGSALLTVRDTGVGMNPEVRDRLFEPFFTTKGVGAGMGLGLSIVHGIVEQHGGAVEVDSEPGEGATFRVRLPLAPEGNGRGGAG